MPFGAFPSVEQLMQDEKYWGLRDVIDRIAEKHGRAALFHVVVKKKRNRFPYGNALEIVHRFLNRSLYFLCKNHKINLSNVAYQYWIIIKLFKTRLQNAKLQKCAQGSVTPE